jgi:intein/homing endonuclease
MNRRRIVSDELLPEIIKYYLETKSMTEVSKKFDIKAPTLYYTLNKEGVDLTIDLKRNGERVRKFAIDPDYFEEINTRDKAYITGMLHSDGCITRTGQVRIKLCDLELLEEISSKIYKDRPLYNGGGKGRNKKNKLLVITQEKIYRDVQKHGCCLDKTYNLEFPTTIPNYLMGDYLRGFFDGDGSIYIYEKKSYRPATVKIVATRKWAENLVKWLKQFDIDSAIYDDKRHDNRITGFHVCNVPSLIKFYDLIYKDIEDQIFLKRKFDRYSDYYKFKTQRNGKA